MNLSLHAVPDTETKKEKSIQCIVYMYVEKQHSSSYYSMIYIHRGLLDMPIDHSKPCMSSLHHLDLANVA
jgi:hypothetical protein